jgi:hypothetical protein
MKESDEDVTQRKQGIPERRLPQFIANLQEECNQKYRGMLVLCLQKGAPQMSWLLSQLIVTEDKLNGWLDRERAAQHPASCKDAAELILNEPDKVAEALRDLGWLKTPEESQKASDMLEWAFMCIREMPGGKVPPVEVKTPMSGPAILGMTAALCGEGAVEEIIKGDMDTALLKTMDHIREATAKGHTPTLEQVQGKSPIDGEEEKG